MSSNSVKVCAAFRSYVQSIVKQIASASLVCLVEKRLETSGRGKRRARTCVMPGCCHSNDQFATKGLRSKAEFRILKIIIQCTSIIFHHFQAGWDPCSQIIRATSLSNQFQLRLARWRASRRPWSLPSMAAGLELRGLEFSLTSNHESENSWCIHAWCNMWNFLHAAKAWMSWVWSQSLEWCHELRSGLPLKMSLLCFQGQLFRCFSCSHEENPGFGSPKSFSAILVICQDRTDPGRRSAYEGGELPDRLGSPGFWFHWSTWSTSIHALSQMPGKQSYDLPWQKSTLHLSDLRHAVFDWLIMQWLPGEGHHLLDFWQFLCCSVPHLCPKSQDFRALLQLPQCIISTTRGPETEMFESLKMLDDMKQTWQIICILGQQSLNSIFWSCISSYSMPFEGTGKNCMGMILKTTHLSSVCLTGSDDMHKLEIIYHSPPARWGSLDFMRVTCSSSSSSCFLLPSLLPPSRP